MASGFATYKHELSYMKGRVRANQGNLCSYIQKSRVQTHYTDSQTVLPRHKLSFGKDN